MDSGFISDKAEIGLNCQFGHNAMVEDGARIGDGVILGPGAYVMSNVCLGDSVEVGAYSVLGKPPRAAVSARLEVESSGNLVIGDGSWIGALVVINSGSELSVNCYVGDHAAIRESAHIGEEVMVGRFVSVERATIGNRSRVGTGTGITGVVEDDVFIASYVVTTNDKYMVKAGNRAIKGPVIKRDARIGSAACILADVTVGQGALIGLGAVVISDVPPRRIFIGVPARDAGEVVDPM